jgi:hypothetical protein
MPCAEFFGVLEYLDHKKTGPTDKAKGNVARNGIAIIAVGGLNGENDKP